ncbi:hypothetical protein DFS34DRAFT_654039 [Phlyctochytrium arcticum]|nr:hypothetical protein DFS34DRAFT_654039 [Phlyctochytrium arcticum]
MAERKATTQPMLMNRALNSFWDISEHPLIKSNFRVRKVEEARSTPADMTFTKLSLGCICVTPSPSEHENDRLERTKAKLEQCIPRYQHVHILVRADADPLPASFLEIQALNTYVDGVAAVQIHSVYDGQVAEAIFELAAAVQFARSAAHDKFSELLANVPEAQIVNQEKWMSMMMLLTPTMRAHDCFVLQEGMRTISQLSQATPGELRDCSLTKRHALDVHAFFETTDSRADPT